MSLFLVFFTPLSAILLIYFIICSFPSVEEETLCTYCFQVLEWKLFGLSEPRSKIFTLGAYVQWFREDDIVGQKLSTKKGHLSRVIEDSVQNISKELVDEKLSCRLSSCTTHAGYSDLRGFEPGKEGIIAVPLKAGIRSAVIMPHKTENRSIEEVQKVLQKKINSNAPDLKEVIRVKYFFLSKTSSMNYGQYSKDKRSGWNRLIFLSPVLLIGIVYLQFKSDSYNFSVDEFENNYEILGLPAKSPYSTVKNAFRKLAKQYHPDKNPGCSECASRYAALSQAYRKISTKERRKMALNDVRREKES